MIHTIQHWVQWYRALGWPAALGLGAAGVLVTSLVGLLVVLGLPANYFLREPRREGFWHSHLLLRVVFVAARNLLGCIVFLTGVVMALPLVPGPGALFMLVGLAAVDFPGKRRLQERLLSQPKVLASVNRLRARFGRSPLMAPGAGAGC